MPIPRLLAVLAPLLATACATALAPAPTVFLVRHAETEGGGRDPHLSAAGLARAEALADVLAGERITRVLTTDYHRTRATAQPIAARLGIEPEIYDPSSLPQLAAELREAGGTILVVGHSNTTPELARLLGVDPVEPMPMSEHDRLYRIELESGRSTVTRFDAPR